MIGQPSTAASPAAGPWYRELNGNHWWVLIIASLGWLFDTMDQRLFVLSRGPAMTALLPAGTSVADITWYSSVATAIFMLGWAIGGFYCGILGDRWGRAKTMMLTILVYSCSRASRRFPRAGGISRCTVFSPASAWAGNSRPASRWWRK